jgi:hypothetical protein
MKDPSSPFALDLLLVISKPMTSQHPGKMSGVIGPYGRKPHPLDVVQSVNQPFPRTYIRECSILLATSLLAEKYLHNTCPTLDRKERS